jgi:hypothetical protein
MEALIEMSNHFFWLPEALIIYTLWQKLSSHPLFGPNRM